MFVRYFIELPLSADRVEEVICASPASWIPGIADEATARGVHLLGEIGLGERARLHRVAVELGEPMRLPSRTVLPIRWRPTTGDGLLPALDADIEVARLTPESAQLSMSARYVPAGRAHGNSVDRGILHRVAEATVKDFIDRVGAMLIGSAASVGSPPR